MISGFFFKGMGKRKRFLYNEVPFSQRCFLRRETRTTCNSEALCQDMADRLAAVYCHVSWDFYNFVLGRLGSLSYRWIGLLFTFNGPTPKITLPKG